MSEPNYYIFGYEREIGPMGGWHDLLCVVPSDRSVMRTLERFVENPTNEYDMFHTVQISTGKIVDHFEVWEGRLTKTTG